jgi:hypothetical protein
VKGTAVLRLWCVALVMKGRGCRHMIFDDYHEARLFRDEALQRPEYKVVLWEL